MATASTAVWIPEEVLENILHHLPVHDLVLATRICKAFAKCVKSSITLQRKLFLVAEPTSSDAATIWNPFFFDNQLDKRTATLKEVNKANTPMETVTHFAEHTKKLFSPRLVKADASYMPMFLTQPPCESASVGWRFKRHGKKLGEYAVLRNKFGGGPLVVKREGGIRFQDLWDSCEGEMEQGAEIDLRETKISVPVNGTSTTGQRDSGGRGAFDKSLACIALLS